MAAPGADGALRIDTGKRWVPVGKEALGAGRGGGDPTGRGNGSSDDDTASDHEDGPIQPQPYEFSDTESENGLLLPKHRRKTSDEEHDEAAMRALAGSLGSIAMGYAWQS